MAMEKKLRDEEESWEERGERKREKSCGGPSRSWWWPEATGLCSSRVTKVTLGCGNYNKTFFFSSFSFPFPSVLFSQRVGKIEKGK